MRSIEWREGKVRFLDQTRLPSEECYVETDDEEVVAQAIRTLSLRGAPLIGIAAAYGFALAFRKTRPSSAASFNATLERVSNLFRSTRPTAVNLFWAIDRMRRVAVEVASNPTEILAERMLAEALRIHEEDAEQCRRIGIAGAELLPNAATVLTHCNTGSLATGGDGTALSVLNAAWQTHKLKHVYVDETRPLLQGARLTTWELQRLGIPFTLITDSTAAFLMQRGAVTTVIVGADRITANGDVANKVGTYGLAVQAHFHNVAFVVAAPTSTFDGTMQSGKEIPIEERSGTEVTEIGGIPIAPAGVEVYSPAFDITPNELVNAIVTEYGVLRAPFRESIGLLLKTSASAVRQT
jgi:methylthioribose-1-phosphate isomerase